jgi:release factor glutamine methyltransferase
VTVEDWFRKGEAHLSGGPHPERARADAETLLLYLLGKNKAWRLALATENLREDAADRYTGLLERRAQGEPIQYITGEAEFYGLPFHVTRAVLIPRPETEHVVEKAIELAAGLAGSGVAAPRIVDVGTGSGAIAVALAHQMPAAQITAIDCSAPALAIARENAERNGVADRIRFLVGDLLAPVAQKQFDQEQFEIVVSNPPYVPEGDRASLAVEVRGFEPAQALFAGADGLAIYRRLIPAAFAALAPGGFVVLEIGYGQQAAIRALLADSGPLVGSGFEQIGFAADLQGIPRVAFARRG